MQTAKIWVELDLVKTKDDCATFRGQVDEDCLSEVLKGDYSQPFFTLYNTHWLQEDESNYSNKEKLKYYIYGQTGTLIGLEGTAYFRAKDIREISLLEKNYSEVFEAIKNAKKPVSISKFTTDQ